MKMKGAALPRAPAPFCRPCFTSDAQWNGTGRTLRLLSWLLSAGARAPTDHRPPRAASRRPLRSTGYGSSVQIDFPQKFGALSVMYDNCITRCANNDAVKCFCIMSCLWIVGWPLKLALGYDDDQSLSAYFRRVTFRYSLPRFMCARWGCVCSSLRLQHVGAVERVLHQERSANTPPRVPKDTSQCHSAPHVNAPAHAIPLEFFRISQQNLRASWCNAHYGHTTKQLDHVGCFAPARSHAHARGAAPVQAKTPVIHCRQRCLAAVHASSESCSGGASLDRCNASFISFVTKARPSTWPTRGVEASYLLAAVRKSERIGWWPLQRVARKAAGEVERGRGGEALYSVSVPY